MSSLSEDASRFRDFELAGATPSKDPFQLEILERSRKWKEPQIVDATSTAVLEHRDEEQQQQNDAYDLRIIQAPLDIATLHSRGEFMRLFRHLGVPSAFVSERLQSVRHSFGGQRESQKLKATWFHFLCRRPNLREYERLQQGVCDDNDGCPLSLWDRFGLFMRVNQPGVSLTLFGAGEDMKIRLRELLGHERWEEVLADPYVLLDVILDELYLQMDRNVQDVSRLFGNIESKIINSTQSPGQATAQINFRVLHNLSKDVIYLEESFESIIKTAESISHYHRVSSGASSNFSTEVQDGLEYRRSILISSRLQVKSLRNRIQNLIDLAFHLVTQNESHIFQQDSFSMHALALVSLLFVPLASISSFLGTPYFNVPASSVVQLNHGPKGIMWGVGGATLVVFSLWLLWYWSARIQMRKGAWDIRNRLRNMVMKRQR